MNEDMSVKQFLAFQNQLELDIKEALGAYRINVGELPTRVDIDLWTDHGCGGEKTVYLTGIEITHGL